MHYLIGIDEAGRGSWAGPVVAWAFCVPLGYDFSVFPGLTDSKQISERWREILYDLIADASEKWGCIFTYGSTDAETIDRVGIREANRLAMEWALEQILQITSLENITEIQIDGRDNYIFPGIPIDKIRYIIRWDLTQKVISAASIVAKVTRDRMMCDFSLKYSGYYLDRHKGYGTRRHQEALLSYGITPIHRKSYAPVKRLILSES